MKQKIDTFLEKLNAYKRRTIGENFMKKIVLTGMLILNTHSALAATTSVAASPPKIEPSKDPKRASEKGPNPTPFSKRHTHVQEVAYKKNVQEIHNLNLKPQLTGLLIKNKDLYKKYKLDLKSFNDKPHQDAAFGVLLIRAYLDGNPSFNKDLSPHEINFFENVMSQNFAELIANIESAKQKTGSQNSENIVDSNKLLLLFTELGKEINTDPNQSLRNVIEKAGKTVGLKDGRISEEFCFCTKLCV